MLNKKYKVLAFILALFILVLIYFFLEKKNIVGSAELLSETQASLSIRSGREETGSLAGTGKRILKSQETGEQATTTDKGGSSLFPVHIMGQVQKAGVYYVNEKAILTDVIELAGGLTAEADLMLVNLAEPISPHQKIYIPSKAELEDNLEKYKAILQSGQGDIAKGQNKDTLKHQEGQKVNINRADMAELQTLTGIGPSRAEAIIRHREEYGDFVQIEDLMLVPGIKENSFKKLKNSITVD